jgi:hypothetical protein
MEDKIYKFEFIEEITKTCTVSAENVEQAFEYFMSGIYDNETEIDWKCLDHYECIENPDNDDEE